MADFDAALEWFAGLDEATLGRPWSYRDKAMDVRYAIYRSLEDAQEVLVDLAARPQPESRRILALAQRAFGDLRGLLIGLPADLLDRTPRAGEWSIGEVLRHVAAVERRYALHTRHAVQRSDADPVRLPDSQLPPLAPDDTPGDVGDLLARIGAARAETNGWLGDVPPDRMTRPTTWMHYAIDVRFRLHRFAAHIAEHVVQCEKTLAALGWQPAEGRRAVRPLSAVLGEIEGLGGAAAVRPLQARLVERFASTASA